MLNKKAKKPTGADSCSLSWFGYLLKDDGLYAAKDVVIYWNKNYKTQQIDSVAVVYKPLEHLKKAGYNDHPIHDLMKAQYNKKLFSDSSGAAFDTWMTCAEGEYPIDPDVYSNIGYTPEGDFKCLEAWGFVSSKERERAIREFARIRECQWARDLLNDMCEVA